MNEILQNFLHQFVIVYIDDILIFSKSEYEHRQHITGYSNGYVSFNYSSKQKNAPSTTRQSSFSATSSPEME